MALYQLPKTYHPDFVDPSRKPVGAAVLDSKIKGNVLAASSFDRLDWLDLKSNKQTTTTGTPSLDVGVSGLGVSFAATTSKQTFIPSGKIGTKNHTFVFVRSPNDATNRNSSAWGTVAGGSALFQCHMPWSNGLVYFDYGGGSGANRISFSSYTKVAGAVEVWVFRAGDSGSQIWLNGELRASQAAAITRTDSSDFDINDGPYTGGDLQTVYLAALLDRELPDAEIKELSAAAYRYFLAPAVPEFYFTPGSGVLTLTPDAYINTNVFYTPSVATGGVNLTPGLFSDSDSFHTATVSAGAVSLTAGLYSDADTFYTAAASVGAVDLTPALHSDSDAFYTATVSLSGAPQDLTPSLFVDSDSFFTSTISVGAVDLTPTLFVDADTFYAATVALDNAQGLAPTLFVDSDVFHAAVASVGAVDLTPALYSDSDTFYVATVSLSGAPQDLTPSLFVDSDTFYAPEAISVYGLSVSLYADTDSFLTPTVAPGVASLTSSLFSDTDTFYTHVIDGGDITPTPTSRTYVVEARNNIYYVQ